MPDREAPVTRDELKIATARRLHMVREVSGLGQGEFGRAAGLSASAYSMIEVGERLPSIESALALCEAYKLSLDYIYRRITDDLPPKLAAAIEALDQARRGP